MQLLRKMVDRGVTQPRLVEYFRKEGYSESEVLDELVSYERERESREALAAPVLDPTKPLPKKEAPVGKQLTDNDRDEMLDMWQRGESEEAIKAMFVMKGFPRESVVAMLEDIKLNPQKEKERVGAKVSYVPQAPKTEIAKKRVGGISKPFIFAMVLLVVLGSCITFIYVYFPEALDLRQWMSVGPRTEQLIIVLPVECGADGAVIEVWMGEARQLTGVELFIGETNQSCGTANIYTRQDSQRLNCQGSYTPGAVYTVVGENIKPRNFKCENRNETEGDGAQSLFGF